LESLFGDTQKEASMFGCLLIQTALI